LGREKTLRKNVTARRWAVPRYSKFHFQVTADGFFTKSKQMEIAHAPNIAFHSIQKSKQPHQSMKLKHYLFLCSLLLAAPAHAAVIANYNFNSNLASSDTEPNSTASNFVATVTNGSSGNFGRSTGGNIFARSNGLTGTTAAAAVSHGNFWSFSVTPVSGQMLNLTTLTFQTAHADTNTGAGAGNTAVTMNFFVRSSVDGFAANVGDTFSQAYPTSFIDRTVNLSGAAFQNLDSTVTFRLYVFESAEVDTNQGVRWDNVVLNGEVVAIPEPSAALLGGIGALLLLRRRRD